MEQYRFKHIFLLFIILNLVAFHLTEGKRSLSGGRRTSSSSSRSSSTRRTQSQTHYSPAPSSSSNIGKTANADHVKLSYGGVNSQPHSNQNKPIGWNVPAQPAGPPPAYSAHNVAGGAKTNIHEPPPVYKPNYAAPPAYPGNNQQSGSSYPKQAYNTASQPSGGGYPHNTAGVGAANTGRTIHNTGYRPHNGTGGAYGGNNSPFYAQTMRPLTAGAGTYHQQGSIQPGFYPHQTAGFPQGGNHPPMPPGGFPAGIQPIGSGGHFVPSGGYASYPQQAAPVYQGSGIQPGFYPAGSFPQKSSGPGLGTGLIAGAIGGAILGHALTPTHTHHVVSGGSGVSGGTSQDQDRIIIINNTPGQPVSVTNANGQPASGVSVIQPAAPAAAGNPEPSVPLAPYPTQQQAQPAAGNQQPNPSFGAVGSGAALANAAATGSTDGTVPLAPFPNGTTDGQQINPNVTQPQYGTYCVPVLVNVTDPNNTANVTTVEQVYCYQVAMPPQEQQMNPPIQNSNVLQQQGQSNDFSNMPTQRTSTASLAANSNIKNGVKSNIIFASSTKSFLNTILASAIIFSISAYFVH